MAFHSDSSTIYVELHIAIHGQFNLVSVVF